MKGARVEEHLGLVVVVDDHGVPDPQCARFIERLLVRGLSPYTAEAYAFDLALIHRWLDAESLALADLQSELLHRFLAWERGRNSHPKSINRRLHTLRLFYRFVEGHDLPGASEGRGRLRRHQRDHEMGLQRTMRPSSRQVRVKEPRTIVEPLTIEQVRNLLGQFRRYRDIAIAHVMLLCGLRSTEVLLLRLGDVDFEDRRLRLRGKGGKERMMPLPLLLVDILRRYLVLERPKVCAADAVFVILQGRGRGEAMTRDGLRRVFRTRRARKGLTNANPHRLRHTFGTDMARSGVRLPILQRMMGHAFPETTLQYVNISMADVEVEFHRAIGQLERRYAEAPIADENEDGDDQ
jgi:integrase/recombinase XerC